MSQGGKDSDKAPPSLAETIDDNISKGAQEIESLYCTVSSGACIYRVPKGLRKLKESAYTPRLIAIGPLHRHDTHLPTHIQHVKCSYTNYLFCRLTEGIKDPKLAMDKKFGVLQECVEEMKLLIADAKICYGEEVTVDEEMLLMDGCFIIELLYRNYRRNFCTNTIHGGDSGSTQAFGAEEPLPAQGVQKWTDPIFDSYFAAYTVKLDLLLLENQIPFFVLEKLFRLTVNRIPERPDNYSLSDYVSFYFGDIMSPKDNFKNNDHTETTTSCSPSVLVISVIGNKMGKLKEEEVPSSGGNFHILHKLHQDYYNPRHGTKKTNLRELMPSASNLEYATVKFVPGTGKDLHRVKFIEPKGPFWCFRRARFEIPSLGIDDRTETFLRNIIAFEQCCHAVSKHFTSYAHLMDMLVNSEKDVEALEKAGVMRNYLFAKEDVIDLFNKLCKETILGEFYFAEACNKATEYSNRSWQNTIARWRREYYADKWQFLAIYLGFVSLFASIAQVVLALMSLK